MSQVYGAQCNGCGRKTEQVSTLEPAENWHRYLFRDLVGAFQQIDVCPDCWPTRPFSSFVVPVVEEKIERWEVPADADRG